MTEAEGRTHSCERDGEDCSPDTCGKVPRAPKAGRTPSPRHQDYCGVHEDERCTCPVAGGPKPQGPSRPSTVKGGVIPPREPGRVLSVRRCETPGCRVQTYEAKPPEFTACPNCGFETQLRVPTSTRRASESTHALED